MSALTIRLPEKILNETDRCAYKMHISRSEYIRKSIEIMNNQINKNERKNKLIEASLLTRKESMIINSEFSEIENDLKA